MAKKKSGRSTDSTSSWSKFSCPIAFGIAALYPVIIPFLRRFIFGDQEIAALRSWLLAGGAEVNCAEPGDVHLGDGSVIRGLIAACDIAAGADILSVPAKLILSTQTADTHVVDLVDSVMSSWQGDTAKAVVRRDTILAAALLQELSKEKDRSKKQGSRSAFAEYLGVLPQMDALPKNFPVWDGAQRDALSSVFWQHVWRRDMKSNLLSDVVRANARLFAYADEDLQRRVLSIVLSRQIGDALAPWFDFANHALTPNAAQECNGFGCRLVAKEAVAKGSEVTINYGAKSNMELLMTYGFELGDGNNVSLFHINLDPKEATSCADARKIPLDLADQFGLPQATANCVGAVVGKRAILETAFAECKSLQENLRPDSGSSGLAQVLASGRKDVAEALKSLAERKPNQTIDQAILRTLYVEVMAVERCVDQTDHILEEFFRNAPPDSSS